MNSKQPISSQVTPAEYQLLLKLREQDPAQNPPKLRLSFGERIADQVATVMGSWRFIIAQSCFLAVWVILNVVAVVRHWDPYPFILLNLMLSFQAAYAAPIIMMSQNRQAAIDRQEAKHDYEINMKAELEIELLHDKITLLKEEEIAELIKLVQKQNQQIEQLKTFLIQR
ncbi:MAG: DUF1003 domain-containing protein [Brasilonema octagenarum HA4186-MV1]|jgi:uncharacterized membrane protein|uniref:DUF1003 domain-containing protein n=2 Tax=Brasilonema TaxID=383614 RepID=A0A856MCQ7_9CYAN|nr:MULTISPECIES: DUF1003 domain-containing protein [Brasilonema]MBW4628629.1 DUF1003 domain-containing protein [Brasilonema octagenarum HA4186-MV1]NMF63542.1 hypothetical protein [Brasilonema octagenarum UFV-OR1]QDL06817.1 hypothetical protein DP114_01875 [Brasilonema sennae CENA114]QDL13183.1 hypothetical protein DP113_01835 [Brasilonema octagenarum UFV-E1]